jgi:quercetin dioxygenase-like cupin family protein
MSQATILGPGEGDKFWIVGDNLTFKIGPKETGGKYTVAATHIPPQAGPPPHVHAAEDEMFYILEGTMMFMDNQHTFTAGPGSAVYLPKGIPHTFKNVGSTPVKCILTALPSGFEAFVAECGEAIMTIPHDKVVDEAAIGKLMANCGKYGLSILPDHKPIGEKKYEPKHRQKWVLGQQVTIKLGSKDTGGNFSLVEVTARPGETVPSHKHLVMDEYFYVLEGEFEFTIEDKPVKAPTGTFVHIPKGVRHGFANKTAGVAKLADFHTPGGFEEFFEECGEDCDDASKPPTLAPPDMAKLAAMFRKHGMELG